MRWFTPVSIVLYAILTLGSPIVPGNFDSQDIYRRGLPETLSVLSNNVKSLGFLGAAGAEEADLLLSHLLNLPNGKQAPVTSEASAESRLSSIVDNLTGSFNSTHYIIELATHGLLPANVLNLLQGVADQEINSVNNDNQKSPAAPIYPKKSQQDAPYSVDENALRSAVFIPDTFEYGAKGKIPVLLVPGTAVPAGLTYHFNFVKLLGSTSFADPVWVNIPGNSLGDVQVNAEYVAYAMNYISGVSGNAKIGVVSWSQGGLDTQWALKYWPSTRDVVSDFMPVSPDFHGSLIGGACLGFPSPTCTPAILQQGYDTNLIRTLRADGGDSAYVPTTTFYTSFDEVVQPQLGTDASAYILDARNVGVTNNQVQLVCPGQIAGSIYTHESMLVSPIAWALVVDALTHDGPGQTSRIDLDSVCVQFLPPGLTIDDFLGTESTLVAAVLDVLAYGSWTSEEPPIKPYARS